MKNRNTSNRLERRAERAGKKPGGTPKPFRQRSGASRTPVKVGGGSRFNLMFLLGGAAVFLIIAIVAYAVIQSSSSSASTPGYLKAELDSSTSLPGQYIKPNPGPDGVFPSADDREHFADGTVWPFCTQEQMNSSNPGDVGKCYTSNPPTSGQHSTNPAAFQIYKNPVPKENLVHTMEHGGVVIWYNTTDQSIIDQIDQIYKDEVARRKLVTVTPYPDMEPNTIAVTAWTRLDKFSVTDFTRKRVVDFIEAHSKRFNPEGF